MDFVVLREEEYEEFVTAHKLGGFSQSVAVANRSKIHGWTIHYVGVRDNLGYIRAAAMMKSRVTSFRRLELFECTQGPIMDYDNDAVVEFFFTELSRYLRKHNAVRLRISPPLLMNHRDKESNIRYDGYYGKKYITMFQKLGFVHIDNTAVDKDPTLPRWYAVKDLSKFSTSKQVLDSFDTKTKWSINNAMKVGVNVKALSIDEIDQFYDVLEHTTEKRPNVVHDKQYYRDLARHHGDNVQFCIAELDLAKYEKYIVKRIGLAMTTVAKIHPNTKNKEKQRQRSAAVRTEQFCQVELLNVQEMRQTQKKITVAGAVFVRQGKELMYLNGRSYEKYSSYGAPYLLHFYAHLYAMQNELTRYNMSATRGNFSGNPEQHGAYLFKKGFGAVVEEQVGYFELYPYQSLSTLLVVGGRSSKPETSWSRPRSIIRVFDESSRRPVVFNSARA